MKRPLSCLQDHARVFSCEMSIVTVENLSNIGTPWCQRPCGEVEWCLAIVEKPTW